MTANTAPIGSTDRADGRVIHLSRGREWRGGERQVVQLARALHDAGRWRQILVTAEGSRLARAARDAGIPVAESRWRIPLDPRVVSTVLRQLRSAPAVTLLHVHDSHALVRGILASRIARCPLIATRRSTTVPGRLWRVPDRGVSLCPFGDGFAEEGFARVGDC